MRALALALLLGGCAGGTPAPATQPAPKPGSTVVRGRFIGWAMEPGSTVSVLDCKAARSSQNIRRDGTFELRVDGCPPGVHHLVFGKNASGLLKFSIRGPVTDVGTIEGGQQ